MELDFYAIFRCFDLVSRILGIITVESWMSAGAPRLRDAHPPTQTPMS